MPREEDAPARASIILINDGDYDVAASNRRGAPKGRRLYTAQRNAKLLAAVKEGASVSQIAADFNLTRSGVYAILHGEGVSLLDYRTQTESPLKLTERNNIIIDKYKSGLTAEQIGQEFGISRERVCQILRPLLLPQLKAERSRLAAELIKAEKETMRETLRADREAKIAQAVQLVREGASRNEAARETGLRVRLVQNGCDAAGLPRNHGRWHREGEFKQRSESIRRQRAEGKTWGEIGHAEYSWAMRHLPDLWDELKRSPKSKTERRLGAERKPPPVPQPDLWTDEKVALLCRMYFDGCSAQQIADVLGEGFTRNSVIGKTYRLRAQKLLVPPQREG